MKNLVWVTSAPATHFTTAVADAAIELESLDLRDETLSGVSTIWNQMSAPKSRRQFAIRVVNFTSLGADSVTGWKLWFFRSATLTDTNGGAADGDVALSNVIGVVEFSVSADAHTIAGVANTDYFTDHDINLPIFDGDPGDNGVPKLHIGLQPIGDAADAYADGTAERVIRVGLEPMDYLC